MVVDRLTGRYSDRVLHALSDPTRRDIVATVLAVEHSVSALARRYPMSFAAVQKHVAVLESAQLVRKRRRGREQLVLGDIDALRVARAVLDELEALWHHRVSRMHELLTTSTDGNKHRSNEHRSNDERSPDDGSD
jgi:DNA-binding transcriptional ArsR family regulator